MTKESVDDVVGFLLDILQFLANSAFSCFILTAVRFFFLYDVDEDMIYV